MWRPVLILAVAGCGGIKPDTPINELDAEDWAELCEDATKDAQPVQADCGAFQIDEPAYSAADCEADAGFLTANCSAVVGDWETCFAGTLVADPCNPQLPTACDLVAECSSIQF